MIVENISKIIQRLTTFTLFEAKDTHRCGKSTALTKKRYQKLKRFCLVFPWLEEISTVQQQYELDAFKEAIVILSQN